MQIIVIWSTMYSSLFPRYPMDSKSSLVLEMALYQTGARPLLEAMITQLTITFTICIYIYEKNFD